MLTNKKRYFFACALLVSFSLVSGCVKVQEETLEKTSIPDVQNIAKIDSEITTESQVLITTEVTTEATTEAIIEITTHEAEPYVRQFEPYIELNEDFMGWIKIEGTSIDDPIVQGDDNAHYLEYDYTDTKNYAGAIFLDYKNQGNFYDNHMSLYAHYMEDGSMFHDLHKYKEEAFLNAYPEIILSGLRETETYEIFSVHIVSAYDYYLYLDLNDTALKEYAAHFKRLSMFDKPVTFPEELKLLTLVTCTYEFENARLLIHAYQK